MGSPTSRSLQWLKDNGYLPWKVEQWLPKTWVKRDLYNCIDIVAMKDGEPGLLGIQATSTPHINERLEKIGNNSYVPIWLRAGLRLEVWGWAKRGGRGKRKLWTLTRKTLDGSVIGAAPEDIPLAPACHADAEGAD
jgi:hypothetical protein